MRPALRAVLSLAVAALMLAAAVSSLAPAHTVSGYYTLKYSGSNVDFRFASDFPNTSMRQRVKDSGGRWTTLPDANLSFSHQAGDVNWGYGACPGQGHSGIHWDSIDGAQGILASVRGCVVCPSSCNLREFQMVLDFGENWWNETNATVPSNRLDSESIATHEFGHAGGFGLGESAADHFEQGGTICTGTPVQTMCPTYEYGRSYWRSLEGHDIHTFQGAY